jgi:uncharacterized protein YggE
MSRMNRLRNILVLGGFILVAAAIAGVLEPHLGRSAAASSGATISVSGTGTARGVPDRATFDFGVTTDGATAAEALTRNADRARAIIAALKRAGVAASQIQTTEVSLWPRTADHGRQIVGYSTSNSVQATVVLGRSGAAVDAAVRAGAENVDGPNLTISDQGSLRDDALKQALANAKAKAQTLATGSGLTLGVVERVTESAAQTPYYASSFLDAAARPVSIQPGTQEIQATVRVTYRAG